MDNKKTNAMDELLNKAKGATNTSYKSAEKADKKEGAKVGRKPVADKKKARQVYYNDAEYAVIEKVAEGLGIDAKTYKEQAIAQRIIQDTGKTLKQLTELEELVKEREENV